VTRAIRNPRQSALGVDWCEDFSRGRAGVVRNQGIIHEAGADVVGFDGKWIVLPGQNAWIEYPRLASNIAEMTLGCWIKGLVDGGSRDTFVALSKDSGHEEAALGADTPNGQIGGVWNDGTADDSSGENILDRECLVGFSVTAAERKMWLNGVQIDGFGGRPPTIPQADIVLSIGASGDGSRAAQVSIADPFIVLRELSDADWIALNNRSLFV